MISITTTNISSKILPKNNNDMGELRTTFIQNKATIDYLFLKHNFIINNLQSFGFEEFSQTTGSEINDLHKELDKISQVTFEWLSWLR